MKMPRNHPKERDPIKRAKCFSEVSYAFTPEMAMEEAKRCLNCKHAPCRDGCPVNIFIPDFITEIKNGNFDKALDIIKRTNNLPAICGRVCPQELQCESRCVRAKMEGAVAIGALERFAADYGSARKNDGTEIVNDDCLAASNASKADTLNPDNNSINAENNQGTARRVAVVGSGPGGLTVAADCAKAGLKVCVYEAFHQAGGVLVYGIPEFRLPKNIVLDEIENLKALGVDFKLNQIVGKTITIKQLKEDYDAIFLGIGAGLPQFLNIAGEGLIGVYSANEYLTRVNLMKAYKENAETPVQHGKNVVVFGAGNVAMDAARTALRMGADNVFIVYRRTREEMPARLEEIVHAEQEGVKLMLLASPVEILGKDGMVSGVRCLKCELGEPDASGRRSPKNIEGSEFVLDCDMVIEAVGTNPNPLLKKSEPQLETNQKGTIIVDESLKTNIDSVYAGGDAVTGAATVILAMGAGKRAAKEIIDKLS